MLPGWNLFSVPVLHTPPLGESAWKITENSCGGFNVWRYDANEKSYERFSLYDMQSGAASFILNSRAGFWGKVKRECNIVFSGAPLPDGAIEGKGLLAGWNLVGAGSSAREAAGLLSSCQGASGPFYYDSLSKWVKSAVLEPGKAYFIKAQAFCRMWSVGEAERASISCKRTRGVFSQGSCACPEGSYWEGPEDGCLLEN